MINKQQKVIIFTYASLNIAALLMIAERIRGKRCTCDDSQRPKSGSFDWVIFIKFEDEVEWLFPPSRSLSGFMKRLQVRICQVKWPD